MENTDLIKFGTNDEEWFIAMGGKWIGPLQASNVYDRIKEGQIGWAHYAWKYGMADWLRMSHVRDFAPALPEKPPAHLLIEVEDQWNESTRTLKSSKEKVPPPPPSTDDPADRVWYLHYNDAQFGPFSTHEIERYLEAGKIHAKVFVWKDGFDNWQRLEQVSLLKDLLNKAPSPPPPSVGMKKPSEPKADRGDQRHAPRRPMVAKVLVSNEKDVLIGVCRDISIGGMQILVDSIPGSVGDSVKINVSPSDEQKGEDFKPFVAEGKIVRHLEDGRGFSVRFHSLDAGARSSIMKYVQN